MTTLIIGGAASGKSGLAEALCLAHGGPLTYIATMQPFGADALARIARHKTLRAGKGFATVERYTELAGLSPLPVGTVLLECLGNLAANELFAEDANAESARQKVLAGVAALELACENLVVVTNDVFCDGAPYSKETLGYIHLLGGVNQALAERFTRVAEVVCGIPIWHKGGPK